MDLSDEQRTQVLETLWSIMSHFVDLGFGVNSDLLALPQRVESTSEMEAVAKSPTL
jgi:hypothetical protein